MKIGIAGCSGTGKSILAEKLASELDIPFLPSKDITGDILQREGYDYSSGQQVEKFLATNELQNEILKRTIKQQSIESFVTDRTALDLTAYAIVEMEGALNVKKQ
jgi:adenylate kinase family enzyme